MQTQYLFVNTSDQGKARNDPQRRSHVMQNRLKPGAYKLASVKTRHSQQAASLASGKTRFRLFQNGMERHYSDRPTRKPANGPVSDASQDCSTDSALYMQIGLKREGTSSEWPTGTQGTCQYEIQHRLPLSTSPLLLIGVARIDPLGVLPIELSPWDEVLLDRCLHYTKYPWCPINGQSLWAPFALTDKLVLHATMYAWSMSFRDKIEDNQASSWLKDNPDTLQHKLSTISLIKTRIADPDRVVKDETVAAVVVMTFMEVMHGKQDTAAKHMDGLKILVN
jgi:Fungal specific transcription factor domain